MMPFSFAALFVVLSCLQSVQAVLNEKPSSPKVKENTGISRVKQLKEFHSILSKGHYKLANDIKDAIIEAPVALHQLRRLISEEPQENKCDKYYDLIKTPIKLDDTARLIAVNERLPYQVLNRDANLIEGLQTEKRYNALGRISAIVETLQGETWGGKSLMDVKMQDELLGCLAYFVHRHQISTLNVVDYIKIYKETLRPDLEAPPKSSEENLQKMDEYMDKVVDIESLGGVEANYNDWIIAMEVLCGLIIDEKHNIPEKVKDFLIVRSPYMRQQAEAFSRLEDLKKKVIDLESLGESEIIEDQEYESLLNAIKVIAETNPDVYKAEFPLFLNHADRARALKPNTEKPNSNEIVDSIKLEKLEKEVKEEEENKAKSKAKAQPWNLLNRLPFLKKKQ